MDLIFVFVFFIVFYWGKKVGMRSVYFKYRNCDKHTIHIIRDERGNITSTTRMTERWFNSLIEEKCEIIPFDIYLPGREKYKYRYMTKKEQMLNIYGFVLDSIINTNILRKQIKK